MHCPTCQAKVKFADMSKHRCPRCAAQIYWMDRWRWLRGISCGFVSLLIFAALYRFYPFDVDSPLIWFLSYCVFWFVISFALLLTSISLLPPDVDLVPQDGP